MVRVLNNGRSEEFQIYKYIVIAINFTASMSDILTEHLLNN